MDACSGEHVGCGRIRLIAADVKGPELSSSFEFPGEYYEIIRRDFRNTDAETTFFTRYLSDRGRVLDLGCGTGTNLHALAQLGHRCVGVDQSESFLAYAARHTDSHIKYIHSRAANVDIAESFDLVFAIFVTLNYFRRDDLPVLLQKVRNWIGDSGRFVVDIGHMLNFVENYQPYIIAHHRSNGVLITRMIRHLVDPHRANWRHEETILVRDENGDVSLYENFFDQLVLTAPELRHLLEDADLHVLDEFGGFQMTPPAASGRGHLVWVVGGSG